MAMTETEMVTRMVPLDWIKIGADRRAVDNAAVERLAESIESQGLLQPIGARTDGTLVWGNHRYRAFQRLGREKIPCVVCDMNDLDAELAEIDENLMHSQLSSVEATIQVARRKELYEARHPEARHGGDHTSYSTRGASPQTGDLLQRPPSFVADTAAKTGRKRGTIERDVRIGRAFSADELQKLKDARVPVLMLDKLATARKTKPEYVASALNQPVENIRYHVEAIVGGGGTKRHGLGKIAPKRPSRKAIRKAEGEMRRRSEEWVRTKGGGGVGTPTCQTNRYSTLGANTDEVGNRTVTISADPSEAAMELANHFDREGMEGLFFYLKRYLLPETVAYVLRKYGEENTNVVDGAGAGSGSGISARPYATA
jgi:hypothetical protein